MPGLTARETEILRLVVAGHTYREIASALVISEKTVSAHISNLLRKTSTANRVELAQKYRRLTSSTTRPVLAQRGLPPLRRAPPRPMPGAAAAQPHLPRVSTRRLSPSARYELII
jgi:DNA-binding CsgD family transcriptional regulator